MALALSGQRKSYYKSSRGSHDYGRDLSHSVSSPPHKSVPTPPPDGGRVQSRKWYKEPRIPIHMNMSTMIRMKSNEGKCTDEERDSAYTLYADDDDNDDDNNNNNNKNNKRGKLRVFSPPICNRRMFDYMQRKFDTVKDEKFFGSTYTKNLFWRMVAEQESRYNVSANACGDGTFPAKGTYQRVAAINVQTAASGCNLQYIEKISIHSKTKCNESGRGQQQIRGGGGGGSQMAGCEDGFENLSVSRTRDRGCGESGGSGRGEYRGSRKKTKKCSRKPVVVTCLKNTSIKYVRK